MTMRPNYFGRPNVPGESRGIIPLILGGLAVGGAAYKAISANQRKQRMRGYIGQAFRSAQERQQVHEGDVRQGTAESLNARGLGSTGAVQPATVTRSSPEVLAQLEAAGAPPGLISQAMRGKATTTQRAPSTIGGRVQSETNRELGLERTDLLNARDQAYRENSADYFNELIGAGLQGAQGVAGAYGASQDLAAMQQLQPQGGSKIRAAMMGVDDPTNWYGGVNGVDPLNAPGSSWNPQTLNAVAGTRNYDFNLT